MDPKVKLGKKQGYQHYNCQVMIFRSDKNAHALLQDCCCIIKERKKILSGRFIIARQHYFFFFLKISNTCLWGALRTFDYYCLPQSIYLVKTISISRAKFNPDAQIFKDTVQCVQYWPFIRCLALKTQIKGSLFSCLKRTC